MRDHFRFTHSPETAQRLFGSEYPAGEWEVGIDADGIWTRGPHTESFTQWKGWSRVVEQYGFVLLCHDERNAFAIPTNAFASEAEKTEVVAHIREAIERHRPMLLNARSRPRSQSLSRNALRIAAFLPVDPAALQVSWPRILALVVLTLIPPLAYAVWSVGDEGYFAWMSTPAVLFHVVVILVAAVIAAAAIGRREQVVPLLAATLLAYVVIDSTTLFAWALLHEGLEKSRASNLAFFLGPLAWLALAVGRFAVSLGPVSRPRAGLGFVVLFLFLALPLGAIYRERSFWTMDYSRKGTASAEGGRMAAASEEAFYRQPELLRDELAALQPGRKGVVDVYLVAMAGWGSQDVFKREVDSVAQLFRERFDAEGHVVALVNNPSTALVQPMASATGLKAALHRVAEVMDRDEDVLVIFLTSHGSPDHQVSMQNGPLRLNSVTPAKLRALLDESGIRNRVVVVSSCYSGGFVPALQGDDTLVIAAAAPDRTSFGCDNEADWTYFGKAYFDEALRKTRSFIQAFEIAKPVIEEREKAQRFDPSQPQMSVGSAIRGKLDELERQLESSYQAVPDAAPRASMTAPKS
jgi:hypothetical protein